MKLHSLLYLALLLSPIAVSSVSANSSPKSEPTRCIYPDSGRHNLYARSYVSLKSDIQGTTVLEECGFGSVCTQDNKILNGKAHCTNSLDNDESPYKDFSCGVYTEWIQYKTKLEVDCRCRKTGSGSGGAGGKGNKLADPNNIDITKGARPGGGIINCSVPDYQIKKTWPIKYGKGPNFGAWKKEGAARFSGGIFDPESREFFSVVRWSNPKVDRAATVVAWNIDTKNRRIVSGSYPDRRRGEKKFGSGYLSAVPAPKKGKQALTGGAMLRFGTDRMLYLMGGGAGEGASSQREIVKIDPKSGKRTLVWKSMDMKRTGNISEEFGQCFQPDGKRPDEKSVAIVAQAFAMGPDNEFYLSMDDNRAGDGILRISPDGKTCTPLSVWGTAKGHKPGGGQKTAEAYDHIGEGKDLQFPVKGMLYYDDPEYGPLVLGVSNRNLYSFAIKDGFRALESHDATTYHGMGYTSMFYEERDGHRVIWTAGTEGSHIGAITELGTGRREPIYSDTTDYNNPILKSVYGVVRSVSNSVLGNNNRPTMGGFMIDPENPDIAYMVLSHGALAQMELSTFNAMIWSY